MKKDSDDQGKTSRRKFAASIFTAFMAAPLTSLIASAQQRRRRRRGRRRGQDTQKLTHIPPVIITDGSFIIETDEELDDAGPGSDPKRPKKYKHRNGGGGKHIRCVTIKNKRTGFCRTYTFRPGDCIIEIDWDADKCHCDD